MFDYKRDRKYFSKIGLSCLSYLIIALLAPIAADKLTDILFNSGPDRELFNTIGTLLLMYLLGVPLFFLCIRKLPCKVPEKAWPGITVVCGGFCACFTLVMIGYAVGVLTLNIVKLGAPDISGDNAAVKLASEGNIILNFLVMVIIAPVVEELVFRKLIIDRVIRYGDKIVIVFSALIFGLSHGNLTQSIYTFFLGLALAYFYVKTGNILLVIIYHSISNFISSVLVIALKDNIYVYIILIVIICIVGAVTFFSAVAKKRIVFNPGEKIIPRNKIVMTVVMNLGMIVYIFACCGLIYATA